MKTREVWLWGCGGHFRLEKGPDGSLCIPGGQEAWESFCWEAPREMIEAAIRRFEAIPPSPTGKAG